MSHIDKLQERRPSFDFAIEMDLLKKIERKEGQEDRSHWRKSAFHKMVDVFGDKNVLWWFLPVNRLAKKKLTIEDELDTLGDRIQ